MNPGPETLKQLARLIFENESLKYKIITLYDVVKHGDDEHRKWLRDKIDEHFDIRDIELSLDQ